MVELREGEDLSGFPRALSQSSGKVSANREIKKLDTSLATDYRREN